MSQDSINLGSEGTAFPFNVIGDTVEGTIMKMEEVQQTDMDSGLPATWTDGSPKMMWRVILQTSLRDGPDDDGKRSVYLRGSKKPESKSTMAAALVAVKRATGSAHLQRGGWLKMTYSGNGVPPKRGYSPPKEYESDYRAPGPVAVDLGGQPPQQPYQPAPAHQPSYATGGSVGSGGQPAPMPEPPF